MVRHLRSGLLVGLALLVLSGCCNMTRLGNPELPYPPERAPKLGDILHLPTGYYVSQAQMLQAATDSRIVYVGETHDNPASHRLELTVLKALAERYPHRVALGMEMLTPAQQPALDAWVAGQLSEKQFLKQSNWYGVWRMNFAYYRALFLFARDHQIPLIGINADKKLVHAVGRQPLQDLPPELQAELPDMDLTDPYQDALVEAIYSGHSAGKAMLDGFHRVQTLWDETMAQNIATYMKSPLGDDVHLMVMAGGNHIRNGFGIPRRVFRRLPLSYQLIGSRELSIPKGMEDRVMNVTIPHFPMPAWDYLVYTDYETLPPQVKLGVMLNEKDGRVLVAAVVPGSAAATAGLQTGDQITGIDQTKVTEEFDLVYAIQQKHPGDPGDVTVLRDGKELTLPVTFTVPPAHGKHPKK